MTLTIIEAAAVVGVSPFTVRTWVARDQLLPVRVGAHPLLFRESDVVDCSLARMSNTRHARLDAMWALVVAVVGVDE